MGVHVDFNYAVWIARYPEFAGVDPAAAQGYFNEACIYHRNDGGGPVTDCNAQQGYLNMVTAHIAHMYASRLAGVPSTTGQGATPAPGVVGRISNASEGSVSVSTEYNLTPGNDIAAWYAQTKYGASYWTATSVFRTFRYIPGSTRVFNPPFGGGGGSPY